MKAVEDGLVAWEELRSNKYDLLITDNNMPNMTGIELLNKLQSVGQAMPVIMATGTAPDLRFPPQAWNSPAITLRKPYTVTGLLRAVESLFCAEV